MRARWSPITWPIAFMSVSKRMTIRCYMVRQNKNSLFGSYNIHTKESDRCEKGVCFSLFRFLFYFFEEKRAFFFGIMNKSENNSGNSECAKSRTRMFDGLLNFAHGSFCSIICDRCNRFANKVKQTNTKAQ